MSGSPPKSIFLRPPRYGKLGFVLPVNPVVLGLRFCDPSVNLGRGAFPLCPESILRSLAAVCEFSVLVPRLSHGRRVSGSTLRSVRRTGRGRRPVGVEGSGELTSHEDVFWGDQTYLRTLAWDTLGSQCIRWPRLRGSLVDGA